MCSYIVHEWCWGSPCLSLCIPVLGGCGSYGDQQLTTNFELSVHTPRKEVTIASSMSVLHLKFKSPLRLGTYPTSNAKSLACDTANEHALERHAAAVRQLSNGTNGYDLYICIAMVGNTIQTVNSPMYDTYMSTPGNTAKLGTAHSNIQTAQSNPSLVGSESIVH